MYLPLPVQPDLNAEQLSRLEASGKKKETAALTSDAATTSTPAAATVKLTKRGRAVVAPERP